MPTHLLDLVDPVRFLAHDPVGEPLRDRGGLGVAIGRVSGRKIFLVFPQGHHRLARDDGGHLQQVAQQHEAAAAAAAGVARGGQALHGHALCDATGQVAQPVQHRPVLQGLVRAVQPENRGDIPVKQGIEWTQPR